MLKGPRDFHYLTEAHWEQDVKPHLNSNEYTKLRAAMGKEVLYAKGDRVLFYQKGDHKENGKWIKGHIKEIQTETGKDLFTCDETLNRDGFQVITKICRNTMAHLICEERFNIDIPEGTYPHYFYPQGISFDEGDVVELRESDSSLQWQTGTVSRVNSDGSYDIHIGQASAESRYAIRLIKTDEIESCKLKTNVKPTFMRFLPHQEAKRIIEGDQVEVKDIKRRSKQYTENVRRASDGSMIHTSLSGTVKKVTKEEVLVYYDSKCIPQEEWHAYDNLRFRRRQEAGWLWESRQMLAKVTQKADLQKQMKVYLREKKEEFEEITKKQDEYLAQLKNTKKKLNNPISDEQQKMLKIMHKKIFEAEQQMSLENCHFQEEVKTAYQALHLAQTIHLAELRKLKATLKRNIQDEQRDMNKVRFKDTLHQLLPLKGKVKQLVADRWAVIEFGDVEHHYEIKGMKINSRDGLLKGKVVHVHPNGNIDIQEEVAGSKGKKISTFNVLEENFAQVEVNTVQKEQLLKDKILVPATLFKNQERMIEGKMFDMRSAGIDGLVKEHLLFEIETPAKGKSDTTLAFYFNNPTEKQKVSTQFNDVPEAQIILEIKPGKERRYVRKEELSIQTEELEKMKHTAYQLKLAEQHMQDIELALKLTTKEAQEQNLARKEEAAGESLEKAKLEGARNNFDFYHQQLMNTREENEAAYEQLRKLKEKVYNEKQRAKENLQQTKKAAQSHGSSYDENKIRNYKQAEATSKEADKAAAEYAGLENWTKAQLKSAQDTKIKELWYAFGQMNTLRENLARRQIIVSFKARLSSYDTIEAHDVWLEPCEEWQPIPNQDLLKIRAHYHLVHLKARFEWNDSESATNGKISIELVREGSVVGRLNLFEETSLDIANFNDWVGKEQQGDIIRYSYKSRTALDLTSFYLTAEFCPQDFGFVDGDKVEVKSSWNVKQQVPLKAQSDGVEEAKESAEESSLENKIEFNANWISGTVVEVANCVIDCSRGMKTVCGPECCHKILLEGSDEVISANPMLMRFKRSQAIVSTVGSLRESLPNQERVLSGSWTDQVPTVARFLEALDIQNPNGRAVAAILANPDYKILNKPDMLMSCKSEEGSKLPTKNGWEEIEKLLRTYEYHRLRAAMELVKTKVQYDELRFEMNQLQKTDVLRSTSGCMSSNLLCRPQGQTTKEVDKLNRLKCETLQEVGEYARCIKSKRRLVLFFVSDGTQKYEAQEYRDMFLQRLSKNYKYIDDEDVLFCSTYETSDWLYRNMVVYSYAVFYDHSHNEFLLASTKQIREHEESSDPNMQAEVEKYKLEKFAMEVAKGYGRAKDFLTALPEPYRMALIKGSPRKGVSREKCWETIAKNLDLDPSVKAMRKGSAVSNESCLIM